VGDSPDLSCVVLVGPVDPWPQEAIRCGQAPRLDYRLLAERGGGVLERGYASPTALSGARLARLCRSFLGNLLHALRLAPTLVPGSLVYSTGETWGIPLGLVGVTSRRRDYAHIIYVHRVFSPAWLKFLTGTRDLLAVDGWICVTRRQAETLRRALGPGGSPVTAISQGVDTEFFDPAKASPARGTPYVLAVGAEMRNYGLLFDAVRDLDIQVIAKVSSAWMTGARHELKAVPDNVRVITQRLSYVELRDLYAGAALVAAPLYDTPQAAGITTILEGMAMGKCIVATESSGLPDVLVNQSTGVVVPPRVEDLRSAIAALWEAPDRRATLARNGQLAVRTGFTIERHAAAVTEFLLEIAEGRLS
jgi:glycosyltransferase involved in cell wall biosynthesis